MYQFVSPIAWTEIKFIVETKTLKEEEKKKNKPDSIVLCQIWRSSYKFFLTK